MSHPFQPPENARPESASGALRPEFAQVLDQRRRTLSEELRPILSSGKRFTWEVGCGHGHFLAAYASAHPQDLFVGIDIASERIGRARRKRDRARLGNLHFIQAEARFFLQCLPPGPRILDVFVLFPDPWPKSRHHKHRILQPDFLAATAAAAAPEARLHFRTDFRPYFEDACAAVRTSVHWEMLPAETRWPFEYATVFQNRADRHDSFIARRMPSIRQLTEQAATTLDFPS